MAPFNRQCMTVLRVSCAVRACVSVSLLPFNGHINTAEQRTIIQQYSDWYTLDDVTIALFCTIFELFEVE